MQIGANIINQWDSGNVPIFFNFNDSTGNYELAGIKNLPYLSKLVFEPYWASTTSHGSTTYQFAAWLVPSLWNPNQNAPPTSTQNVQIRIAMTGGTLTAHTTSPPGVTMTSITVPSATPGCTPNPNGVTMTVNATAFGPTPSGVTTATNVS